MAARTTGKQVGAWSGGLIVAAVLLTGLFAQWLAPGDPLHIEMSNKLSPPSWTYPLGTDHLGRCVLSRLIYGVQTTVYYALIVMVLVLGISIPLGLLSGYAGGVIDRLIMRVTDMLLAFPSLILSLAIAAMLGPGLDHLLLSFAAVWWTGYVRVVRNMVLQLKESDFVRAAESLGTSHLQIVVRHIFGNMLRPLAVFASLELGTIMLAIASLSFLGLGAQPPTAEWGMMLNDARPYMQTEPHLLLYPGLAIMLTVMGFNLLGEGLNKPGTWDNNR